MKQDSNTRLLDWLDQRTALQFCGILYVARWIFLAPVIALDNIVFTDAQEVAASIPDAAGKMNSVFLLFLFVIISPLFETLVECSLPYLIISRIRNYRQNRPKRCWGFIAISACVMALFHPMLAATLPSLITGAFLAYCYAHFAEKGVGQAILATIGFHGAINIVGWTMVIMS